MLVPHLLKVYFGLAWLLWVGKDIITIKIDVKNHKKINKQKRLLSIVIIVQVTVIICNTTIERYASPNPFAKKLKLK